MNFNKKFLFIPIALVIILFSFSSFSIKQKVENIFATREAQAQITSGLVGYWNFDEGTGTTASDSSGSGNTGTLTNGPTWTTGKIGQALSFDGVNDYVNVGDTPVAQSLTVSVWAKSNLTDPEVKHIFSRHPGWYISGSSNGIIRFAIDTGTWTSVNFSTTTDLNWHLYTGVYDGANITTFLDGIQINKVAKTGNIDLTGATRIGTYWNVVTSQNTWNGLIDDVRIYNRALSVAEVTALYNLGR